MGIVRPNTMLPLLSVVHNTYNVIDYIHIYVIRPLLPDDPPYPLIWTFGCSICTFPPPKIFFFSVLSLIGTYTSVIIVSTSYG